MSEEGDGCAEVPVVFAHEVGEYECGGLDIL